MAENPRAVLVSGATGFLGRRLCERLRREGERVIALGRRKVDGPWEDFVEVDLAREELPRERLEGVSTVFHLASKAHAVAESADEAEDYRPIIVGGTRRMLRAATSLGARQFIYVSSVKAMGEGNPAGIPLFPLDETSPHTPQGPYGRAKVEAESMVLESEIEHTVVLRPTMVFGSGEKGNLPRMVEAIRRGRFPPIPECGNKRSMIHVDDVVEFSLRAGQFPRASGRTYILCHPEPVSTRQLYDAIRLSLGMPVQPYSVPSWLLTGLAGGGSLAGAFLGRRLPFDLETLGKLTGSAWYSPDRAGRELRYTACHSVLDWIREGG